MLSCIRHRAVRTVRIDSLRLYRILELAPLGAFLRQWRHWFGFSTLQVVILLCIIIRHGGIDIRMVVMALVDAPGCGFGITVRLVGFWGARLLQDSYFNVCSLLLESALQIWSDLCRCICLRFGWRRYLVNWLGCLVGGPWA